MKITRNTIPTVALAIALPVLFGGAKCSTTGTGAFGPMTTGWDSTELQTQIGDRNRDKKKLVMRYWYAYGPHTGGGYEWYVVYSLRAEDHNTIGSGWHSVSELYSFNYSFTYTQGNAPITKSGTKSLDHASAQDSVVLYSEIVPSASLLPSFVSESATGQRYGGPSGISLSWP